MTPTLFPSVFTIEIGGKPTVTFEAKSLCEASEICNAPWLREDFASAHSNGAPLWDGKADRITPLPRAALPLAGSAAAPGIDCRLFLPAADPARTPPPRSYK